MSSLVERVRDRLWVDHIGRTAKPRKGQRRLRMIARPTYKSPGSLHAYLDKPRPGRRRR